MKKKTALVTGISGQDGAYLADLLLKKKYKVIGTDRRSARMNNWRLERLGIEKKIIFEEMELGETFEIERVFKKYNIDEVYNLAAQSFVGSSFGSPLNTSNITGLGVLRILETIRNRNPKIKFYQASSSEMFGDVLHKTQNEKTPFNPQSPYAISKLFGHYITVNYRNSYNLFTVSGILFNHESPLRGEEFVTRKIVKGLVEIINNKRNFLELGNLDAKRDWGFAKEYVEAMWKMLQQKKPNDYVIATGKTFTIKEFVNKAAKKIGLKIKWAGKGIKEKAINLENGKVLIECKNRYFRPVEVDYLKGNAQRAKKILKWKPKISIDTLIDEMIKHEENLS